MGNSTKTKIETPPKLNHMFTIFVEHGIMTHNS